MDCFPFVVEPAKPEDIRKLHDKEFEEDYTLEYVATMAYGLLVYDRVVGYIPELTFEPFEVLAQYYIDKGTVHYLVLLIVEFLVKFLQTQTTNWLLSTIYMIMKEAHSTLLSAMHLLTISKKM